MEKKVAIPPTGRKLFTGVTKRFSLRRRVAASPYIGEADAGAAATVTHVFLL